MTTLRKIIVGLLAVLWAVLAIVFLTMERVTLYRILIVAMSGAIVFIPLWKKYFNND